MELIRNNPNISNYSLSIGQELVISYEEQRIGPIKTNGFAFPYIDTEALRKTLPYLTYLTIYSYQIMQTGNLIDIDDQKLINMAIEYNVVPIMFITAFNSKNGIDTDIVHSLITDKQIQENFISNVLNILKNKGYYGINIDTPFIQPEDQQHYVDFIDKITKRLNSEGFIVIVILAPSVFEVSTGIIYEGLDYTGLSQAANNVVYLLTYAWRYPYSLPPSVLPINIVQQMVSKKWFERKIPQTEQCPLLLLPVYPSIQYFSRI